MQTVPLTDDVMLEAAQAELARHLRTRPLTAGELTAKAQVLDWQAATIEESIAASKPAERDPDLDYARGPAAIALRHEAAERENDRVKGLLEARAAAKRLRDRARSCRLAAELGDGGAWEATRTALENRVAYYAALVKEAR